MKRKIPKFKIKELAEQFQQEFETKLPVHVMPNGDIVYKNYVVRKTPQNNWGLYDLNTKDLRDTFFLKSCALMAAKAHNGVRLTKYVEIKQLDRKYWASYSDQEVFKRNIKLTTERERYLILLTRLEESTRKVKYYQGEISRMFTWSFV